MIRQAGFWAAIIVSVLVNALAYQNLRTLLINQDWVAHTLTVMSNLHELSGALGEAEAAKRGFVLTGETSFLQPYASATEQISDRLTHLRDLTSDNPSQQHRLDVVAPLFSQKLEILSEGLTAWRGPSENTKDIIERGAAVTARIMPILHEMMDEEDGLYLMRTRAAQDDARSTMLVLIIGAGVSDGGLLLLFYWTLREVRARREAQHKLSELNLGLEQRVRERTAAIEHKTLELQDEIARREQSEQELLQTKNFLNAIFEHIPAMLFVKEASDGRFVMLNHAGEQLLGIGRDELIGKNDYHLFPPEQAAALIANDRQVFDRRNLAVTPEEPVTTRAAGVRVLRTTRIPLFDESGRPQYLIGFSEDITERRSVEQQLRQAQKMEAVGRLTGGVAHDFNNLLGIILGSTELLSERVAEDPESAELTREIFGAGTRGAELTKRLLAFSRRQPLKPRIISLNDVLSAMTPLLRRTLGADITISALPGEWLWPALADPSQVEDALLNLAVNARDAMARSGNLVIETANVHLDEDYAAQNSEVTQGDYVMLSVADSGTGMPPEVVERAFEPFFTTKESGRGTGLGLSMVYGFVKQSQGHIKIYSEVGHGTTVKMYLPRADREADYQQDENPGAEPTGTETILLVEDNADLRAVARKLLRSLGYEVLEAETARTGLEVLDREPKIDLLFTDVVMPDGMTGYELAREARLRRPGLKVLFTSGYSEAFARNGEQAGLFVHLLSKPYRKQELAKAVRRALDQPCGAVYSRGQ